MEEQVVVWTIFSGACLSSYDNRVELKCDTSELRSKCSKFEKAAVISLLKSVKLILFKGQKCRNIDNMCSMLTAYMYACTCKDTYRGYVCIYMMILYFFSTFFVCLCIC